MLSITANLQTRAQIKSNCFSGWERIIISRIPFREKYSLKKKEKKRKEKSSRNFRDFYIRGVWHP